tara:strand:- start:126 stop:608 length:483 start_codon:yes stop_codon:yes gene_type:complete
MFGFGTEIVVIKGVLDSLSALNSAFATIKESGGNAGSLVSLLNRYASVEEEIRRVEEEKAGVLSVADAARLQIARRQSETFSKNLKNALLVSGQADQWNQICQRIEDSKEAHRKRVELLKRKRARRQKAVREACLIVGSGIVIMFLAIGLVWLGVTIYKA